MNNKLSKKMLFQTYLYLYIKIFKILINFNNMEVVIKLFNLIKSAPEYKNLTED